MITHVITLCKFYYSYALKENREKQFKGIPFIFLLTMVNVFFCCCLSYLDTGSSKENYTEMLST